MGEAAPPSCCRRRAAVPQRRGARRRALAPLVAAAALAAVGSTVDSAFLAALVAQRLAADGWQRRWRGRHGRSPRRPRRPAQPAGHATARTIVATTWGDTLCWRVGDGGVVVASEPGDDGPGWVDVPDRTLLIVTGTATPLVPGLEGPR